MYAITHDGLAIGTEGVITDIEGTKLEAKDADAYNRAIEAQELEAIRTGQDRLVLYVRKVPQGTTGAYTWQVTTWLGTVVCRHAYLSDRIYSGWNRAYRRSMSCMIMGRHYVGYYMESSGDYCRLRLAKRDFATGGKDVRPYFGPWSQDPSKDVTKF